MLREVIAVIHLPRLPSLYHRVDLNSIIDYAVREVKLLEELGYSGIIVENYGDYPYSKRVRDPVTLCSMTSIVKEVVRASSLKVGVNLLRNSGREAYSVAVASGARFIRVNALVETIISDSGVIEPEAPRLRALRLNYPGVEVYADILVKHASSLRFTLSLIEASTSAIAKSSVEDYYRGLVEDYVERGGADALVVTGLKTGELPPIRLVELTKKYSPKPVIVGSGVTLENIDKVAKTADGLIIGSYIKKQGHAGNPTDPERARKIIKKIRELA
ncbi:MAG: BtpA/SgcQ family protein [Desulfurococcaceae archaeon]|nr:BtpA/SgcQ family protein [Desulfurococcaceae archaeon]